MSSIALRDPCLSLRSMKYDAYSLSREYEAVDLIDRIALQVNEQVLEAIRVLE